MKIKRFICSIIGHKWSFDKYKDDTSAFCDRCRECVICVSEKLTQIQFEAEFNKHFRFYKDKD